MRRLDGLSARFARSLLAIALLAVAGSSAFFERASAQRIGSRTPSAISARTPGELREWDGRLRALQRGGTLRLRLRRSDLLVPGRTHERFDQYYRGVRVYGGDVAQQLRGGQLISIFGRVYDGITVNTIPAIDADTAQRAVAERTGAAPAWRAPELVVLPEADGPFALAWRVRATLGADLRQYFIDAGSGALLSHYSITRAQSTVGRATGVLGDSKKISVSANAGRFLASDLLRPPSIVTYDLQGDPERTMEIVSGAVIPGINDIASDTDNDWQDGAAGDAHIYSGWTYDYFFKRFGRRGLDNDDLPLRSIVHPVRRENIDDSIDAFPLFFVNAVYYGEGLMVYGVGLPPDRTSGGRSADFFSGALDVVAHELTHGVIEYSSNLIYQNESGALDEAFADIMGTSVERFFQEPGPGLMQADYLIGEDVLRPGGFRSLANPRALGNPDHYSGLFRGQQDNGGVHINSGIAGHAFYLAVEGGTNRTSGLSVEGVGHANREQIEQVFYRAFTQMLPSSATFSLARAATIQAARDLHGVNSPSERAVTQAWNAVGVH